MQLKSTNLESKQSAQTGIVTVACIGLGLAAVAVIGGWALTGTLEDWETVVGGLVFIALLAGLTLLARRRSPILAATLLAGFLFLLVSVDVTWYGLGSPSAMAFLLPMLLIACILGLRAGLIAAALSALVVFGVAWASVSGALSVATPVEISHLSYNAPVISVILFFCAGLVGYAVEAYRK